MKNSRLINHTRLVLWLAVLLALTSCQARTNGQANSPLSEATNPVMDTSPSPVRKQMESDVTLRVHEQTEETVIVELRNDTDQPIYVSYTPPKDGNKTTFLAYGLERKTKRGDFKPYGSGFHFVPKLNPIAPRTTVLFQVLNLPGEKGEYRVLVDYDDNADVVKLINDKAPNWSVSEMKQIEQARKSVRSDTFIVLSKPTKR